MNDVKECCKNCRSLRDFISWDCDNEYNKPLPNYNKKMWCCVALNESVMQITAPDIDLCELFEAKTDFGDYPDAVHNQFDNMTGSMNI